MKTDKYDESEFVFKEKCIVNRTDKLVKEKGKEENFGDPKAVIHEWKDKSGEIQKCLL